MTIVEDIEKAGIVLATRFVQLSSRTNGIVDAKDASEIAKEMNDLSFVHCSANSERPSWNGRMWVIKRWLATAEAASEATAATAASALEDAPPVAIEEATFGGKRRRKSRRGRKTRRKR